MAYLALLWKARIIEKYRLKYEKEKINSILAANTELPQSTFYHKWTVYRNDSQKRLHRIYRRCCPEGSKLGNACDCLRGNWSFVLKVVIAFVGGIVLTYFWYKVLVLECAVWTVLSGMVGVAIALGIAFSHRVRCLVLLLIPGLFSRVGRYTLACYALVLILTGPATNTLKNLDTLSDSLACGQEQIKSSVKQIKESKDSPLNLVMETMSGTVEKIQLLASKIKESMVKIHRLTMSIAHVLQSSLYWLNSVEATCNKKLGTPSEHCLNILNQGIKDCEDTYPEYTPVLDWDVIVRAICFTLKPAEPICVAGDFAKGSIVATIKKKLDTFSSRIQSLLYMAVHIRRSHSCCSNGSLPVSQAVAGIVTDLRNRADPLLTWLSWSCTLTGLFLLLIIFRAKYYQHMFRTRSRFDNRYVTTELRELDLKRKRQGRETVLPLNTRERAKYVATASIRLLPAERMYLTRSIVFMVITTFKLMIHMVADYSLYWVLMNIRYHGSTPNNFQRDNRTASFLISGSGPLSAIVRKLVEALTVPLVRPAPSPNSCLPNPNPPDLQRYAQIGSLILLLWLLALFEPYGLRLRHVITGHYQPERAKARAVWLYYHIIRTRSCFLKYARRKLHRQYKYTSEEKLTFKRWLSECIPCRWLRCMLRMGPDEPHCLLCYTKHRQDDLDRHLKRCDTPSCPGVYCARCFIDIGQLCTICYSPEDYGDLSDVSLEKITSDDNESDDSDDDDDDKKGDAKPILRTTDHKLQDNEHATHRKRTKKNEHQKFSRPKYKDNQELQPLLECDYLNKAYNQGQKPVFKCDVHNRYNLQTQDQSFKRTETELTTNLGHSYDNEEFQTSRTLPSFDRFSTYSETKIKVKGVTIPKAKLGAVVKTMMLLTTKVNDDEFEKRNNHNKYPMDMLMAMFQPLAIFKRMTLGQHSKCREINGFSEKGNHSIYTSIKHQEDTNNDKPLGSEGLIKDCNSKFLPENAIKRKRNKKLLKRNGSMRSVRRNTKRYLEMKEIITNNVFKRLRKRNIHRGKQKFHCRRRRRKNECYLYLSIRAKLGKVFSNKTIENGLDTVSDINEKKSTNIPSIKDNVPEEMRKYDQHNATILIDSKKYLMQETERYIKKYADNFSNMASAGTLDTKSDSFVNTKSYSKKNNKARGIELEQNSDYKIIKLEIRETTPKKLSFWTRLCLRTRNHSPRIHTSNVREELVPNSILTNHKKRKKQQNCDQTKILNTAKPSKVNDDAQSYRISLYLKDREWYSRTAKYNTILDVKKDDTLIGLDTKTSKRLAKEMVRLKKEEMNNTKREEKLRQSNEAKLKKAEQKAKPAKDKRKHKNQDEQAGEELVYTCDKENDNNSEIKLKAKARTDLGLLKKLKLRPKMHSDHYKYKDIGFSEAGLKFSEDNEITNKISNEDNQIAHEDPMHYETCEPQNDKVKKSISGLRLKLSRTHFGLLKKLKPRSKTHSEHCKYKDVGFSASRVTFAEDNDITKTISNEENVIELEEVPATHCETDKTQSPETDSIETPETKNFEPNLNFHEFKHNDVNLSASCSHIWYVEPKKQAICQTEGKNEETLNELSGQTGQSNLQYTTSKCFQLGVKSDIQNTNISSDKSLKNSKRTQLTTIYKRFNKKEIIIKSRDDKEIAAYPELESRGSQYEAIWQMDKQTQVHDSHCGRHVETQCLSAVLRTLQSSAIETERTATRACATQSPPYVSERDKILKELTLSLIPPIVEIDYANEKPSKTKRTRINDTATTHQSTATEKITSADVSTTTVDWWSPILERKEMKRNKGVSVTPIQNMTHKREHKCRCHHHENHKQPEGLKFHVHPKTAQVHPAVPDSVDILSPSRYLIQSQIYSEVYSMGLGSSMGSRRCQGCDELERPSKLYSKLRKAPKTKRLDECYSPRRKMQSSSLTLYPVKWRPAAEHTHALKYYKRSSKKSRKVRRDKERSRNLQSNLCLWNASAFSSTN